MSGSKDPKRSLSCAGSCGEATTRAGADVEDAETTRTRHAEYYLKMQAESSTTLTSDGRYQTATQLGRGRANLVQA